MVVSGFGDIEKLTDADLVYLRSIHSLAMPLSTMYKCYRQKVWPTLQGAH